MRAWFVLGFIAMGFLSACSTTTEKGDIGVERKQLMLVSSEEIRSTSAQAYEKTKQDAAAKGALDRNPAQVQRVQTILKRLIPATAVFRQDAPAWQWEAHVLTSDELNAYCMPGGKIAFYSAIIEKLKLTDAEMAAIMGHEIAHALREHGRERMSEMIAGQGVLQILAMTGHLDSKYAAALAGLAAQMIELKHSRGQESEADDIGLELMARAGYDPREAVTLWKKMAEAGGAKPPEILSSHPADETRMTRIQGLLPRVLPLYEKASKSSI